MNASRAQCSKYIVAATARTVSATLRTLMFESIVAACIRAASLREPTRRIGSAMSTFRIERETCAGLERLVDRDARLRALGGGNDGELHVV